MPCGGRRKSREAVGRDSPIAYPAATRRRRSNVTIKTRGEAAEGANGLFRPTSAAHALTFALGLVLSR
jgi:hypothetical protein